MVEVSIILCTQGTHPLLPSSVAALADQQGVAAELLVVVDGDAAELRRRLGLEADPTVRVICERDRGLNTKRNRGITEARGDLLLFTDDDCIAAPSWAARMAEALRTQPVVTGRVAPLNRGQRVSIRVSKQPRTYRGSFRDLMLPWTAGCGNSLGVRRSVFTELGMFGDGLGVGTWSGAACDTEFLFRVLRSGDHSIGYEPRALTHHQQPVDRGDYLRKRRMYYRGISYMVRRFHPADPLAWLMALLRLGATAVELPLALASLQRTARQRTWAQWRGAWEGFWQTGGTA